MDDIKVELLAEKAMHDGTFLSILMKLEMDAEDCEIFDSKERLLGGNHRVLVASQGNLPIGILAYNQTKGRIDRLCAKTPDADQKLRVRFAKFKPKIKSWLLGTPTFTSPPGYTSAPDSNYEDQIRFPLILPPSAIEEEVQERSTGRLTKTEKTKSMLGFTAGRRRRKVRLHTRRRKVRNGSSKVL